MALGGFLRMSFFYRPFPFVYKFVLHTHSHVILLGWVFNALCALIVHFYKNLNSNTSSILYYLFQCSIVGMLFSFPFQGYALQSIIFSTLHILLSYAFAVFFLIKTRKDNSYSTRFIRLGMYFMCASTIGPFSLGPLMINGFAGTPIYDLAIYFYLHFLCNGFFTFAIIGIFLKYLEINSINYSMNDARKAFVVLGITVLPSFILSTLGLIPLKISFIIGLISGFAQVWGFFYLYKLFSKHKFYRGIGNKNILLPISFMALGVKFFLQLLSAMPQLNKFIFSSHAIIIGYLHLFFIGFITFSILGLILRINQCHAAPKIIHTATIILIIGFAASEILIVLPTLISRSIPHYYILLFGASTLMLVGILVYTFLSLKTRRVSQM